MPIRTLTKFRNSDATVDLNQRLRDLITKGIFFGGQVTPVAGALEVDAQPLASIGADGMVTILEGSAERLTIAAGIQWVLLHAEYIANAAPIAALEVLTTAAYDALGTAEKTARIKLAKVTIAIGATSATVEDISYTESDIIDQQDRDFIRGKVDTKTSLPDYTDPPDGLTTVNRTNDIYFVEDEKVFYHWNITSTPQWSPVLSAEFEFELNQHRLNVDDGTVPPDFFDAQHLNVAEKNSVEDGPASLKAFGTEGAGYGTGNALMDERFPVAFTTKSDFTGLVAVTRVQLSGLFYVGSGVLGTAEQFFLAAESGGEAQLLGTDNLPIVVGEVRDSTDTFQINPSADADTLGFVEDPFIAFSFSATGVTDFDGDLTILAYAKKLLGQITPQDRAEGQNFGFLRPASMIPASPTAFTFLSPSISTMQEALNAIDVGLENAIAYNGLVVTVGPTGSGANYEGDDETPFNTAIAAIDTGSQRAGEVVVFPGTYTLDGTINLTDSIALRGMGDPRTLTPDSLHQVILQASGTFTGAMVELAANAQGMAVRNIAINLATPAGTPTEAAIEVVGDTNLFGGAVIENCSFYATSVSADNKTAIHVDNVGTSTTHDVRIERNFFWLRNDGRSLIDMEGTSSFRIEKNFFYASDSSECDCIEIRQYGAFSDRSVRTQIVGNYVTIGAAFDGRFINAEMTGQWTTTSEAANNGMSSLIISDNQIRCHWDVVTDGPCIEVGNISSEHQAIDVIVDNNHIVWPSVFAGSNASILKRGPGAGTPDVNWRITNNRFRSKMAWGQDLTAGIGDSVSVVSHNYFESPATDPGFGIFPNTGILHFTDNFWVITGTATALSTNIPSDSTFIGNWIQLNPDSATTSAGRFVFNGRCRIIGNRFDADAANVTSITNGLLSVDDEDVVANNQIDGPASSHVDLSDGMAIYNAGSSRRITVDGNFFSGWGLCFYVGSGGEHHKFINNDMRWCAAAVEFADLNPFGTVSGNNFHFIQNDYGSLIRGIIAVSLDCTVSSNVIDNYIGSAHSLAAGVNHPAIFASGASHVFDNRVKRTGNCNIGIYLSGSQHLCHNNVIGNISDAAKWDNDPTNSVAIWLTTSSDDSNVHHNVMRTFGAGVNNSYGIYLEGSSHESVKISFNRIYGAGVDLTNAAIYIGSGGVTSKCDFIGNKMENADVAIHSDSTMTEAHVCDNELGSFRRGFIGLGERAIVCNNNMLMGSPSNPVVEPSGGSKAMAIETGNYSTVRGNRIEMSTSGTPTTNGQIYVIKGLGFCAISDNYIDGPVFASTGIEVTSYGSRVHNNFIQNVGTSRGAITSPATVTGILLSGTGTGPSTFTGNIIQNMGSGIASANGISIVNPNADRSIINGNALATGTGTWANAISIINGADECVVMANQYNGAGTADPNINTFGDGSPSQLNNT